MKRPDIRVVLGRGGSGKTSLVCFHLSKLRRPVCIFDTNTEAAYLRGGHLVVASARDLVAALLAGATRLAFRPAFDPGAGDYQAARVAAFELMNEAAWHRGGITLVWEEADKVTSAAHLPPFAGAIVDQGRHRGIAVIAVARRPAKVPRDLTANASRIIAFRSTEARDLAYYADVLGSEAAAAVRDLPDYHALDWTEKGWAVKKSPFA